MKQKNNSPIEEHPLTPEERDCLEIIRFPSKEDRLRAMKALMERRMLNFSSRSEEELIVRTSVARKLRDLGLPFEWITEHV